MPSDAQYALRTRPCIRSRPRPSLPPPRSRARWASGGVWGSTSSWWSGPWAGWPTPISTRRAASPFWQLTTVLFAIIAIVHVVRSDAVGRTTLALKQVAHWGAFLTAMLLLHSHFVTDLVTGDAARDRDPDPAGIGGVPRRPLRQLALLRGRPGAGDRRGGGGVARRLRRSACSWSVWSWWRWVRST